jgi:hypothetical protein
VRHGRLERACSEAEAKELHDLRVSLVHEVETRDAAVHDAVLHVLRHVGGAHEQDVDGRVPAREGERAVAGLLGAEPGVLEELHRRLPQSPRRRDRDLQTVGAGSRFRRLAGSRSSASR